MIKFRKLALASLVASVSAGMASVSALAQEDSMMLEETVTVGTRGKPRSATDSTAAVDVISGDDFVNQGGVDTSNLLRNVVPSFNVNDQPISDAATLVRPANLRGMAADHTLVLVNGQRRHRASVITWLGNGLSDGAQGPDIAAIPSLALKSVEILRDGAAAQYGSDAIAGVINFNLKDSDEDGAIEIKYGEYKEGDGDTYSIAVNKGFSLGGKGFLNLTGEFGEQDATDRSVQRSDAAGLITRGFPISDPAQVWGVPEVEDDIKLWANFEYDISEDLQVFGQANHNSKTVTGGFYFRNPVTRGGVYARTNNGGTAVPDGATDAEKSLLEEDDFSELLVGDVDGLAGANCAAYRVPTTDSDDGSTIASDSDVAAAITGLAGDDNCFNYNETIPGGFTPSFGGDVTDQSFLLGLRGVTDDEFSWSVSAYWGEHESDFFINNTVNASLGADTPRDFDAGSYGQEDINFNADFAMPIGNDISLAFGAEYREETFTIGAGQAESYIDGGLGEQGFSTSSNGFPGFDPIISGDFSRENYAVYVDSEWDVTDSILIGAAVRYEDFDDFGDTTNFKLGANWAITDTFGARATISTGFKAPTPGQSNASNISTQIVDGVLVNQGVIPSTSPVAQLRGGSELDAETSESFTIGVYFSVGNFDVTVDYFDIDLEDRLSLSSDFELTDAEKTILEAEGIAADDISEFRFFTNQFDTNTSGIDLIVTTDTEWLGGVTTWNLAANYTDTEVTDRDAVLLDDRRVLLIEDGVPDTRINFSASHNMDAWRFLARVNYYGEFYDNEVRDGDLPESSSNGIFDTAYTVDIEAGYAITENLDVAIGGRNIFDETGCDVEDCSTQQPGDLGLQSSQFNPFGINGAFYYGRLSYSF
jgi:iron complex outermembrane receptor protein